MRTGRLEAFSDGVIAIIITIMVLEMKVPHGDSPNELLPVLPVFLDPSGWCQARPSDVPVWSLRA